MISTGELRKGVTIQLENELWQILDYHHIKIGRGTAQVRISSPTSGAARRSRGRSRRARRPRAQLENRPVQFLYRDADEYHFMDIDTYDQLFRGEQLGERRGTSPTGRRSTAPGTRARRSEWSCRSRSS